MLKRLAISVVKRVGFRAKRMSVFLAVIHPTPGESVLDLGCGDGTYFEQSFPHKQKVIGVDLKWEKLRQMREKFPETRAVVADVRMLPFKDQRVDVVFSNSTIEHLGNFTQQSCFAQEVMRVGRRYFVQTPNRYFPIEPHTLIPFFQFLPGGLQKFLSLRFPMGNYAKGGILRDALALLSRKEVRRLFPESKMYCEKIFGLTKSFCVYSEFSGTREIP